MSPSATISQPRTIHAAAAFVRTADVLALSLRKARLFCSGQRRTDRYRNVSDALSILLKPLRT